ncbi:MAG TPA: hypothetical protein PK668_08405 [Myxococcota bacterium]|nr:hypothetical protein [Myxococcota bacterium]HRY93002.1 hypothetical protein [Myxococcota bacterium]HSA21954.1 hypothetical protein [Myxococcota bacterium]
MEASDPTPPRAPTPEEAGLFERHWTWLRARCGRLLPGEESAEAVAAQSLARLVREGAGGDERARLLRLSGDLCAERLRGQGRLDAEWKAALKGPAQAAPSPLRAQILARLPGLRPDDRPLVLDRWLDGRSVEEIAGARGLKPQAVARRLERFRAAAEERQRAEDGTGLAEPAPALDAASLPAPDAQARAAALGKLLQAVDALPSGPATGRTGGLRDPGVWGPAVALTAFAGLLLYMLWPTPPERPAPRPLGPLSTSAELLRYQDNLPDRIVPGDGLPADEALGFRVSASEDRLLVAVRLPLSGAPRPVPGIELWPVRAGASLEIPPLLEPDGVVEERLFFFFCTTPVATPALLQLTAEAYPPGLDGRRDLSGAHLRDTGDCQVRSLQLRRRR